jgi:hypothetical protein
MFSFKKQLAVGSAAEEAFLSGYREPIILAHHLTYDFKRISDGAKLELKTDTYDMHKYPNFFLERWGNVAEKKPGGPWRARRDRVDVFIYFFSQHGVYFEFIDIKELCARADKVIKRKSTKEFMIKNKGWMTHGYAVPRIDFSDLFTQYTLRRSSDEKAPGETDGFKSYIRQIHLYNCSFICILLYGNNWNSTCR